MPGDEIGITPVQALQTEIETALCNAVTANASYEDIATVLESLARGFRCSIEEGRTNQNIPF